jgi:hypothetical protein
MRLNSGKTLKRFVGDRHPHIYRVRLVEPNESYTHLQGGGWQGVGKHCYPFPKEVRYRFPGEGRWAVTFPANEGMRSQGATVVRRSLYKVYVLNSHPVRHGMSRIPYNCV